MSNRLVDGFATYGTGNVTDAVRDAMLAGAWVEISTLYIPSIGYLPWDDLHKDLWFHVQIADVGGSQMIARRVLPETLSDVRMSFHLAMAQIPTSNSVQAPIEFRDDANVAIGKLYIQSTGAVSFDYGGGSLVSSGPVVVANKDHHFEMKLDTTNSAFQLYIDDTKVLDGTGLSFTNTNACAQFGWGFGANHNSDIYLSNLIVRDNAGTYNATFPIGDRRVATLYVNADDADHDGWTPQYLRRFDVGILDLTATDAAVAAEITTDTDIGANEYTFEGQFRLQNLPTSSNKAVLFGKWDGDNDKRSYELYLGGPDLDNGLLVFRTSTDGTDSTVVDKVKWEWKPDLGHWYHIAMCRSSGELLLFIDGVQQGVSVADTDTYFAGTTRATLGAEMSGSIVEPNTHFDGWVDEFRFSIGGSRYTANFTPPTAKFPRSTDDPEWGEVKWLSSWDTATIVDDGPVTLALTALNNAVAITPDDGLNALRDVEQEHPG